MSLLKKTVVLSNTITVGYATIICFGSTLGIKLNLNSRCDGGIFAIKLGSNAIIYHTIFGNTVEIERNITINQHDEIACGIFFKDSTFALGGRKNLISLKDVPQHLFENDNESEHSSDTDGFDGNEKVYSDDSNALNHNLKNPLIKKKSLQNSANEFTVNEKNTAASAIHVHDSGNLSSTFNETTDNLNIKNLYDDVEIARVKTPIDFDDFSEASTPDNIESEPKEMSFNFFKTKHNTKNFYASIRSRLDELFSIYPIEKGLSDIIPDSHFVKIKYDNEDYYCVGLLKTLNKVTHICYAVPGVESLKPPKETREYCDFLKLPVAAKNDFGYFIIMQDAASGELLKVD